MHRSGTSLCSHILSTLGIDMATEIGARESNEKGHWERLEILDFQDRILRLFNRDYYGLYHDFALPSGWWADPRVREIEVEIANFVSGCLDKNEVFGFKDPRTSKLLPMWAQIFRKLNLRPRYIFCVRSPGEVARSLECRDGLSREIGEYRAITYIFDVLRNISLQDLCIIDYESWFVDPIRNLDKICEFLQFEPSISGTEIVSAVRRIIDPSMNHSARRSVDISNDFISELYKQIQPILESGGSGDDLSKLVQEFTWFQALTTPFERQLQTKDAELQTLSAARAELERQLDERSAALQARDAESQAALTQLHAEREQSQAALAQLKAELEQSQAALTKLHAEREQSQAALAQSQAEREQSQAALTDALAQSKAEREQAQAALTQLHAEREQARLDIVNLEVEGSALAASLAATRNSTSWRVTRPLRQLRRMAARLGVRIRDFEN
jgi:hypothetical protein